tara:strand:- start:1077 stop:1853 length:777 start_codon:yes stop_codon:yes gene_type:complete
MAARTDPEPLYDGEEPQLTEIPRNAGFAYELDVYRKLRDAQFNVDPPAGADSAKADIEVKLDNNYGKITKFELKEKLSADFAQMNFDWDSTKGFYIDKNKKSAKKDAAKVMIGIAEDRNILDVANTHWDQPAQVPGKFVTSNDRASKLRAWNLDKARFPDKKFDNGVAARLVEKYYNSKDTYYIQIKGNGLYHMGSDPENFGTPSFRTNVATSYIRIRLKTNSASKPAWSFLMALKIGSVTRSNIDLDGDLSFLRQAV